MLKKFYTSVATAALCLVSASSFAADLPGRAAPAPVFVHPAMSWNGCYAGVEGGYIVSRGRSKETEFVDTQYAANPGPTRGLSVYDATASRQNYTQNGGLIGGTLGCNWQMNSFVLGIEGDISAVGVRGSDTYYGIYDRFGFHATQTTTVSSETNWLGTVRARAGYLVTPSTLIFATGGLAFGGVKDRLDVAGTYYAAGNIRDEQPWVSTARRSSTRTGWTLGGGIEHMITQNWTVKLEGLYYDLGRSSVTNDMTAALNVDNNLGNNTVSKTNRFDHRGVIIRVGANYKFW